MKSLKEEIKEKLTYFPINQTGDYERISNEILKLIEKRIDAIRQIYSEDETDTDVIRHQIKAIDVFYREIKEMLK